jgi:hypothetical protein
MTAWRRAIELSIGGEDLAKLVSITRSRTESNRPGPRLGSCGMHFPDLECRELRHFFYGGRPEVVSRLIGTLATRFGPLNVVGTYSPPMNPR